MQDLDLSGCTSLEELPDLSGLAALQTLDMSGCTSMAALPALSGLTSLQMLDLSSCSALAALPELESLPALQTLDLGGGCRKLKALPDLSNLGSLTALDLGGCSSLEVVALRSPPSDEFSNRSDTAGAPEPYGADPAAGVVPRTLRKAHGAIVTGLTTCRPLSHCASRAAGAPRPERAPVAADV